MRGLVHFYSYIFCAILVAGCGPAQNQVGRVTVSLGGKSSGTSSSALIAASDPIPGNFCYVLYVTGEAINTRDPMDTFVDCGGGGGRIVGLIARNSERTLELPADKNYRFDLLGIRKTWLQAQGYPDCSGTLSLDFGANGEAEVFKINNTVIPEPPIRHFARGDLLLKPTDQELVMYRSLEVAPYNLSPSTDPDIGTTFSCKAEATPILPWAEKSAPRATEIASLTLPLGLTPRDTAHGIIRTGALYPEIRVTCPVDVTRVEVTHFRNGTAQATVGSECGTSKVVTLAGPDLSGNSGASTRYISLFRFLRTGTLVDSAMHRWIYGANEHLKGSVAGLASTGGQLNFAGLHQGHLFVNQSLRLERIQFANLPGVGDLFGTLSSGLAPNSLLTNGLSGSGSVPDSRFLFSDSSNRLFDVAQGRISVSDVPASISTVATTGGFTEITQALGATGSLGIGPDMIVNLASDGNLYFSTIGAPGTVLSSNYTSSFSSIDAKYDGLVFRQFKTGPISAPRFSAYYLAQKTDGTYDLSLCTDEVSVASCAANFHTKQSSGSGVVAHGDSTNPARHFSEFIIHDGVPTFLRLTESPASTIQRFQVSGATFGSPTYLTPTFAPAWSGKVQFLKTAPYREPGTELSPFTDQTQLVAGGWTSCPVSSKCAVIYRSLNAGLSWSRVYLGPSASEISDAMPHRLPASYLRSDRPAHDFSFLFLEKNITGNSTLQFSGTHISTQTSTHTYLGTGTMTATHTWSGTDATSSTAVATGTDFLGGTYTDSDYWSAPAQATVGPHTSIQTSVRSGTGTAIDIDVYTQNYNYNPATYSSTFTGTASYTTTYYYHSTGPGLYTVTGTTTGTSVNNGDLLSATSVTTHLETSTTTGNKGFVRTFESSYIGASTDTATNTGTGSDIGTYRIIIQDPKSSGY